ncbi:MAG: hypothetical protein JWQ46_2373 [Phenylobacterium sp.]|nr:hypothetical protein [Phenylobacterium sp.]
MSDFRTVRGFEEVWRPVSAPRRRAETVLAGLRAEDPAGVRARLARIVAKAPEVVTAVTGRSRSGAQLKAHLAYISRDGHLELEDSDGARLHGPQAVSELAQDWAGQHLSDRTRRATTPISRSIVLSMPAGVDPEALRRAGRAFAARTFGARFDYVIAAHNDTAQPHLHLTVRALGYDGGRLPTFKPDLDRWRQDFAAALRDQGVEAEATPRRARGITRKTRRMLVVGARDRDVVGGPATIRPALYREAARAAFQGDVALRPWERALAERQARIRGLYLRQAELLDRSDDPQDRRLAQAVRVFVAEMPRPDSLRLALARELRAVNARLAERDVPHGPERGR